MTEPIITRLTAPVAPALAAGALTLAILTGCSHTTPPTPAEYQVTDVTDNGAAYAPSITITTRTYPTPAQIQQYTQELEATYDPNANTGVNVELDCADTGGQMDATSIEPGGAYADSNDGGTGGAYALAIAACS